MRGAGYYSRFAGSCMAFLRVPGEGTGRKGRQERETEVAGRESKTKRKEGTLGTGRQGHGPQRVRGGGGLFCSEKMTDPVAIKRAALTREGLSCHVELALGGEDSRHSQFPSDCCGEDSHRFPKFLMHKRVKIYPIGSREDGRRFPRGSRQT